MRETTVAPNVDLDERNHAIVRIDELKYLLDLEEPRVVLSASPDVDFFFLSRDMPVLKEETVVDEGRIHGHPTTTKKIQSAIYHLQEKRGVEA